MLVASGDVGERLMTSPPPLVMTVAAYFDFFDGQIQWLHRLATQPREPWVTKGLVVRPLTAGDFNRG